MAAPRNPKRTTPVNRVRPGHGQLSLPTLDFLALYLSELRLAPQQDNFLEMAQRAHTAKEELLRALAEAGGQAPPVQVLPVVPEET